MEVLQSRKSKSVKKRGDIMGDPIPGSIEPDTKNKDSEEKDQSNRDSQQPEPKAQEIG